MNEYEVLCDDGEIVTFYALTADDAFYDAQEMGFKPVSVTETEV